MKHSTVYDSVMCHYIDEAASLYLVTYRACHLFIICIPSIIFLLMFICKSLLLVWMSINKFKPSNHVTLQAQWNEWLLP